MTDLVASLSKAIEKWENIEDYLAALQENKREEEEEENDERSFGYIKYKEMFNIFSLYKFKVHYLI